MDNDFIWFNPRLNLPLSSTNFPSDQFKFSTARQVYWRVAMTSYEKIQKILRLEVLDYLPHGFSEFETQFPKAEVRFVEFHDLDWEQLVKDLSYFKKQAFETLLKTSKPDMGPLEEQGQAIITVRIPIKKMVFHNGYVSFDYKFRFEQKEMEVRIKNNHILAEFEHVKSYFYKYLETKYCDVKMKIIREDGKTQSIIAKSEQVDKIREAAVETLKFIKTESIKRLIKKTWLTDKSLFSPADLFQLDDKSDFGLKLLSQNDIIRQVLAWDNVRNKAQLEYLSGFVHDHKEKIRFTLSPQFGFLFTCSGKKKIHFLWELLNSNATYIWSFDKNELSKIQSLEKIEEIVSFIRVNGREQYISATGWDENILFNRVFHKGARSNFVDHFPKWRSRINELLI